MMDDNVLSLIMRAVVVAKHEGAISGPEAEQLRAALRHLKARLEGGDLQRDLTRQFLAPVTKEGTL